MFDPASMYLRNLAKRAIMNEHIYPAEIVNAPRIIDKVYGNSDGQLNLTDIEEIANDAGSKIADAASEILDTITSIF